MKDQDEFIIKFLSIKGDSIKDNFIGGTNTTSDKNKTKITTKSNLIFFLNDLKSELYIENNSLISYKTNLLKEFKEDSTYEKLDFGDDNLIKIPFIGLEILYRTHRNILTENEENKLLDDEKKIKYRDIIISYINAIYGAYNLFQKIAYYKRIGIDKSSIGNRKRETKKGNQRENIRLSRQYRRLGLLQYEFTGITGWTDEIKLLNSNIIVKRVILMHPSFVFDKDYRDFMYKCFQFNLKTFGTLNEIINNIDRLKKKKDEMENVWDKVFVTLDNLRNKYESGDESPGLFPEISNI